MKYRHGFVSNSSSSSFILAFPEPVNVPTDVQRMLLPGEMCGFAHDDIMVCKYDLARWIYKKMNRVKNKKQRSDDYYFSEDLNKFMDEHKDCYFFEIEVDRCDGLYEDIVGSGELFYPNIPVLRTSDH